MRRVGPLPATGPDQAGCLQPVEHQLQQPIGAALLGQPGTELGEHRRVEPGIVEVQAEGVLPRDPVGHRPGGVSIREVVTVLQNHHHRQQGR
jgi:hypothetical protein